VIEEVVGAVHHAEDAVRRKAIDHKREHADQEEEPADHYICRHIFRHHTQEHRKTEETQRADDENRRVGQRVANRIVLALKRSHRGHQQRGDDRDRGNLRRGDGQARDGHAPSRRRQRQEILASTRLLEARAGQAQRKDRPDQQHRRAEPPQPDIASEFSGAEPRHLSGCHAERAVRV
jgi:hypothetical protein